VTPLGSNFMKTSSTGYSVRIIIFISMAFFKESPLRKG